MSEGKGVKVNVENPANVAPVFVDSLMVRDSGDTLVLGFCVGKRLAVEVMPTVNIKAMLIVTPKFSRQIPAALVEHLKKMKKRKKVKLK